MSTPRSTPRSTPSDRLPPELDPRRSTAGRRTRRAEPAPRAARAAAGSDRRTLAVLGALVVGGLAMVGVLGVALAGFSDSLIGGAVRSAGSAVLPAEEAAPSAAPSPSAAATSAPAPPAPPAPVDLLAGASVAAFDPLGDGSEHDSELPLATDGDPTTAWTTDRYESAAFGGLKDGLGLVVDLGSPQPVTTATVTLAAPGTRLELRAGDDLAALTTVATAATAEGAVALTPASPVTARYVVVWMTELGPAAGGGFRAEVAELTLG